MSHIELAGGGIRVPRGSLHLFRRAVEQCGGVFHEGQTTYRSWATDHGALAGDYDPPEAVKQYGVGRCEHAVGLKNAPGRGTGAYEIGLVPDPEHPDTYFLAYDYWGGAIDQQFSSAPDQHDLGRLMGSFAEQYVYEQAAAYGESVQVEELEDGSVVYETE